MINAIQYVQLMNKNIKQTNKQTDLYNNKCIFVMLTSNKIQNEMLISLISVEGHLIQTEWNSVNNILTRLTL